MRIKIDYGIDLGTTNSAISRLENGTAKVIRNDYLKDTTPSVVHYNKRKEVIVGDPAYNILKADNIRSLKNFEKGKTNTFFEFKRKMGTTELFESTNFGNELTPEQLSADVLKKLKTYITDENFSAVVITVPAKFLTPQLVATERAAKLAGFEYVELLQEPVAAATAYGLEAKNKNGYWVVFDFGGGTFDVALIKASEGILDVKDTEGDNWLGGKNLDEAIVEKIILPHLQENYAIDSIINDPTSKIILANAVKHYAEDTKIQMSSKDKHSILSQLGDLPFEDENGEEPEIDIEVTQQDIERVFSPIFQKAIDITKSLLQRNNLKGSDIQELILVGGPTYSPILRRMLKEQVTPNVNTSVDPMTVVAKGAALYASTINIPEAIVNTGRNEIDLQLEVNYNSSTVETDEMINVKILADKTKSEIPDKVFIDIVRGDKNWQSGQKLINTNKSTLIDVLLVENTSNAFEIIAYDGNGNKIGCQPNQFNIIHGVTGAGSGMITLPYYFGIGIWDDIKKIDVFEPATGLDKNKKTPATGTINNCKTSDDIRPGMINDFVKISLYQGEHNARGTNLIHNYHISDVIITGENFKSLLKAGSRVDITINVNNSGLITIKADFPDIGHYEEVEVKIENEDAISATELRKELSKAKRLAKKVDAQKNSEVIEELENELSNDESSNKRLQIRDNLRKQMKELEPLEQKTEWPKAESSLKEEFYELEELIEKIKSNGDEGDLNIGKIEAFIDDFRKKVEYIIKEKDVREAAELESEIYSLKNEIINEVTGGGRDAHLIEVLDENFGSFEWKDSNKARHLINQGKQKIVNGETGNLRPLLAQIVALMERPEEITSPKGRLSRDGKN